MSETSLRVLLVDDEESARSLLREYLAAYPEIAIAGDPPLRDVEIPR